MGSGIEHEVWAAAAAERVFGLLTDPAGHVRWMGRRAQLDPRPGGAFRLDMFDVPGDHVISGVVLEIDPPRRLAWSWGWEDSVVLPPGRSTVEMTLVPEADGTRIRVRHQGLPAEEVDASARGWAHYLARLAVVAAGGDAGPDPWAFPGWDDPEGTTVERLMRAYVERRNEWVRTGEPDGLLELFTPTAELRRPGEPAARGRAAIAAALRDSPLVPELVLESVRADGGEAVGRTRRRASGLPDGITRLRAERSRIRRLEIVPGG